MAAAYRAASSASSRSVCNECTVMDLVEQPFSLAMH